MSQHQAHEIETRTFVKPDERLDFKQHGRIDVIRMHDGTAAMHAIFEPGWKWSVDEKPLVGNPESCPTAHTGYCLRGEIVIRMVETGRETRIRAGDVFEIPAGHDGYVLGSERCELILFEPPGSGGPQG